MPILWRYLLTHYLKIVLFCVLSFVAILLTMQLDEIAHFTALGAPLYYILLFTFYQIPYILPIALPISCLIAALILVQRLSSTHELTALRASGYGLRNILAPLLVASTFLSFFNFWMVSEIATHCHLTTNLLKTELRSINPLLLLNNKNLMRLKGFYFDALGPTRVGESASLVILAMPNSHQERLNLLIAQHLKGASSVFIGQGVTIMTTMDSKEDNNFDHLLIENIEEMVASSEDFSRFLQKKVWTVNNDYLKLAYLRMRIQEQKKALELAQAQNDSELVKVQRKQLQRSFSEIIRRASLAMATFSFTLMGASFGISISRTKKNKSLFLAIFLTVTYLVAFFMAKGADQNLPLAASLYLIPHFIIIMLSLLILGRISKGLE